MIIIKSQDKLRIVDCLTVIINVNNRKEILANARITISGEDYTPLAEYKTEERAKEVMEDIEEHIEWVYEQEQCRVAGEDYQEKVLKKIYTMPQD